jgi:hypothetical protein
MDHPLLATWTTTISSALQGQALQSAQQQLQQQQPSQQPTLDWATEIAHCISEVHKLMASMQSTTANQQAQRWPALPTSGQEMVTFKKWPKFQQRITAISSQRQQSEFIIKHLPLEWQRAQFLSKTGPGASAFLQTIPSDRGLSFSNDDFTLALYSWLRLPILPRFGIHNTEIPCCCARASGPRADQHSQQLTEQHLLNCHENGLLTLRHHSMTATLVQMCQATGLQPTLEPLAGSRHDQRFRYDLAIDKADGWGRDVRVDVSIRNPLAKKLLAQSSKHRLYAGELGADQKRKHYASFHATNSSLKFVPAVMETYGALHPETSNFVAMLAARVNNLAPDTSTYTAPTFTTYWLQRISVCLQRENAQLTRKIIARSLEQSVQLDTSESVEMVETLTIGTSDHGAHQIYSEAERDVEV